MRAKKHLDKCTEECMYNSKEKCCFGLWNVLNKCAKDCKGLDTNPKKYKIRYDY